MKNKLFFCIVAIFLLASFGYSVYAQKTIQIDKKGALLRIKIEKSNASSDLKKFLEKNKGFILDETSYDGVISLTSEKGEIQVLAHKKGETYTVIKSRNERYDPATGLRLKDFYTVTEKYDSDVYTTKKTHSYHLTVVGANNNTLLDERLDMNTTTTLDDFLYTKLKPLFPVKLAIRLNTEDILKYVEYAQEILGAGQDVNARIGISEKTMLIEAVAQNKREIVEFLLSKGADVNAADNNGQTAIFYALSTGNKKLVEYLKEKGARTTITDNKGQSFAALEAKYRIDFLVDAIRNNDHAFIQSQLAQIIPIDQPSSRGEYPFDESVRNPNRRAFDILLSSGFNPGSGKGTNPEYSLLLADLRYGNGEKVETLLQRGYRLFKGSKDTESAMDYALVNHKADKVVLFMKYNGASFISRNNHIFMFKTDQLSYYDELYRKSSFAIDDYALNQIITRLPKDAVSNLLMTKNIVSKKRFSDYLRYSKENPDTAVYNELMSNITIIKKLAQSGMLMSEGMWEVVSIANEKNNNELLGRIAQDPILNDIGIAPDFYAVHKLTPAQRYLRTYITFSRYIACTDKIDIMKKILATSYEKVKNDKLLHFAVASNQIAMAEFLQKQGFSVDESFDGNTPRLLALNNKNQEMIKALNIVLTLEEEYYDAIEKDDVDALKKALEKGAVINIYYNIFTALRAKSYNVMRYIIEEGNLDFLKATYNKRQDYTEHDIYLVLTGGLGESPAPVFVWEAAIKRGLKFEKSPDLYERNLLHAWLSSLDCEKNVDIFTYVLSLSIDYTKKYGKDGSVEDRLKKYAKDKFYAEKYPRYVRLYEALQAYKKKKK